MSNIVVLFVYFSFLLYLFLKHIDPGQCSSPKPEEKKKKTRLKKSMLPLAAPPPPLFSSTAIFDTHAFFTQTNIKTKKQKKKIDISRQPVIMATNDTQKKRTRTKNIRLMIFKMKIAMYYHDRKVQNLDNTHYYWILKFESSVK